MKNMIDDAIYSASPEITCRRYNPSLGIVLTAGSIALLWANSHVSLFTENDMLSQWNLLISSCILCTGIVMICYRLFGDSSAPVEKRSRERLYRSEYSSLIAAQVLMNRQPTGEIKVFRAGEYDF